MPIGVLHDNPELNPRFAELKPPLAPQAAVLEAHRCLNCFDAPCTTACPTHIDVPGFIKRIASGNLRGAAHRILDANILAGSCARVCPVEVLCEGSCVMHRDRREPIAIALLQRHAIDFFHAYGEEVLSHAPAPIPLRVACIGGGPASLACAAELRRHGAQVTLIERRPLPGGLNTYGVAEYKLRASDSLREVELIHRMGVEFRFGFAIEVAEDITKLESEFDLIFVGVGLGAMQQLGIPGEDHPGIMNALELISAYKTGHIHSLSGTVIVVGAGNTAIDAASAARRLGADEVIMLYRRGEQDISAFDFEYEHAKQEGIKFIWHRLPTAIHPLENNRMRVETVGVRQIDHTLERVKDSNLDFTCDMLVPAIGQSPLSRLLEELRGVEISNGRIGVNRATGQTANPRYFAGGDCVNGGREVVDAVADGKRAALGMLDYKFSSSKNSEATHA
jgi:dihydropyrimidine dehydrogenase (NAD+) subunit PreT